MSVPFPEDRTFLTPALVRLRNGGPFDEGVWAEWEAEGRVEKLREGLWRNRGRELRAEPGLYAVANHLVEPSYVSLHAALRYWNIIPEIVYVVTSVTTRDSIEYTRNGTLFSFQTMPTWLYFGFETVYWKYDTYRLATPEKALLDYAYFFPDMEDPDYVYEMRFDDSFLTELIDWPRMEMYLNHIGSDELRRRIAVLRAYADTLEIGVWV